MVCHLPVLLSDVVLGTIYPKKGAQCCCGSPAYDTKHFTLSITRPSSLVERRIKTTKTITEPSFGVVISTISHWDSSVQIIFHITTHKHSDWQQLTWLSLTENGEGRGMVTYCFPSRPAHAFLLSVCTKTPY